MERKIFPELVFEQIAAGEIEAPQALLEDELARQKLKQIEQSNREILMSYPPSIVAKSIEDRLMAADGHAGGSMSDPFINGTNRRRGFTNLRGAALLAAAAIVVILASVLPGVLDRSEPVLSDAIRLKGLDPSINIYRQVGSEATRLAPDERVGENDLLQIAYNAAGKGFGAILSIDGRGIVTLHYPYEASDLPELDTEGEIALQYSYRLDDAPGFERFFFLTSDRLFDIALIIDAAEFLAETEERGRQGELTLPDTIEQFSLVLSKEMTQ